MTQIQYGGRRFGKSRAQKILAVVYPEIRIMKPHQTPTQGLESSFLYDDWVRDVFLSVPGTEQYIGRKFVWFSEDGYHEKPISDEEFYK